MLESIEEDDEFYGRSLGDDLAVKVAANQAFLENAFKFDFDTNSDSKDASNSKVSDSKTSNSNFSKESKALEDFAFSQNPRIRAKNGLINACSTNYAREKLVRILDGKVLVSKQR